MNILREVRRVNKRSMPIRIIFLLTFCVIFIVTTYAWFSTQRNVTFGGIRGEVTSWDVAYYVDSDKQVLDEEVVFEIDEMYPGMPFREDTIDIYNVGKASTGITYELTSVKVFGEEILTKDATGKLFLQLRKTGADGQEVIEKIPITTDGQTTNVFSGDTDYPFIIYYTYDKSKLIGQYEPGGEYEESAHGTLKFFVKWFYEGTGTDSENLAKDELDTQFGSNAYEYYKENDPQKAIEIKVKITSSMIHPSTDNQYPYED